MNKRSFSETICETSRSSKLPQCFKSCSNHSFEKLDQILLSDMSGCVIQCSTCCKEQRIDSDDLVSTKVICGSKDNFFIQAWPKFESTTQNQIQQALLSNSGNSQKYQKKVEEFMKGFKKNILHFIQSFEDDMMKKAERFDQQHEIIVEQYLRMTYKKELKSIIYDENYPDIYSKSAAMKKILQTANANTKNNEKQILNIFEEFKQSSIFNESDLLKSSVDKLLDSLFNSYDKIVKQNSAWMHQKSNSLPVQFEKQKKPEFQKQIDNNLSNTKKQDEQLNYDIQKNKPLQIDDLQSNSKNSLYPQVDQRNYGTLSNQKTTNYQNNDQHFQEKQQNSINNQVTQAQALGNSSNREINYQNYYKSNNSCHTEPNQSSNENSKRELPNKNHQQNQKQSTIIPVSNMTKGESTQSLKIKNPELVPENGHQQQISNEHYLQSRQKFFEDKRPATVLKGQQNDIPLKKRNDPSSNLTNKNYDTFEKYHVGKDTIQNRTVNYNQYNQQINQCLNQTSTSVFQPMTSTNQAVEKKKVTSQKSAQALNQLINPLNQRTLIKQDESLYKQSQSLLSTPTQTRFSRQGENMN